MTTTTATPRDAGSPAAAPRADPGYRVTQARVVASEWLKLRSLRSSWFTLGVAVLGLVGLGALVSYVTETHWNTMGTFERLTFDPTNRSLSGVFLSQLAIGVLGVLVISGEYATGMVRASFAAVPTRLPVVWAKLVVYATVTFVLMLVSSFAAFLIGQQLLRSHGTTLSAPHVLRAVVGVALYLTVVGVLGVALGFVIRSTAGGIAALVGLLLVVPVLVHVLPSSWQDNIDPYLPSNAGQALYNLQPDTGSLAPWTGFGVMCLWALGLVALAVVLVRRRDA